ncbi:hypothetical protein F511_47147 [Dorcoceras hygrometricum]|uniref:Uncharacterized protein n=1 Tax=Dorcoceras hygrometricum TaxID=472368 RepID=A0A2Z6ZSB8_9LAMI|nr:hypothetical protein F511_47147 [Dorcoceras hygrometricum]
MRAGRAWWPSRVRRFTRSCALVANHSRVMGGLSRNGCAIDGRCVRACRASRLDAGRLPHALVVRRCAARGITLGVSSVRWCCDVVPLVALAGRTKRCCWSTPVAQRFVRWPRAGRALVAAACALAARIKFEVEAAAPVMLQQCRDD